jgi:hypothetical protein
MIKRCPYLKPILTYYPKNYGETQHEELVPRLCIGQFESNNDIISLRGVQLKTSPKDIPTITGYIAGGFLFGPSKFIKEVPFDPDLPYLFNGEEILHSARLWTSGWDFFTPTENICYHFYGRNDYPKYWSNKGYNEYVTNSIDKLNYILKFSNKYPNKMLMMGEDMYGLGKERSLEDYYKFIGLDYKNKKFTKDFCKM